MPNWDKRGCAVLIVHIYLIFLSLYIFEEIFFDVVFKCVDIVDGFQVLCQTVPYFWSLVRLTFLAAVTHTKGRHFWHVLFLSFRKGKSNMVVCQ